MTRNRTKRISKKLSLLLRHHPERFGLTLDQQGWCDVELLLQAFQRKNIKLDRELLNHVVANNDKKRFAYNEDGTKIRASQGHSIKIDLGYEALVPPEQLFHGTAICNIESIKKNGLQKAKRHHVHLSGDEETAIKVGGRHGKPVVLIIKAKAMHEAGIPFFQSHNGVWLTEEVTPEYIEFPN